MDDENVPDSEKTPDEVIADALAVLKDENGSDLALIEILAEHIARMEPAETAVDDAVKAIETLAAQRAEDPGNGAADHD